ncbi:MAG: MFS family permease [Bacteriovoracaceae bacterium]|jgi:MFS family permease
MGYLDNSRGPAYPLILKDLSLTPSLGAWFFSLASLAGLIVLLTSSKWLPVIGVVRGTKLSLIIMGLGSLFMGFIPYLENQYFFLLLFSIIFGIGQGLVSFCMNLLVAEACTEDTRSRAYSALHSCYGVASFVAPLVFSQFMEWKESWSLFYLVMSFIPFLVFLLVFKIGKGVVVSKEQPLKTDLSFKRRFIYGGVFSFYVASEIVISTRLIYFLIEGKGISSESAAQSLSFFFLSLMGGRLLFAILPVKDKTYPAMVISLLSSIIIFYFGYTGDPRLLALLGGSMSFYFPMGMNWLNSRFEKGKEQMIASVLTQVGVLLVLMHFFFGELAGKLGVEKALLMAPVLLGISLLFLIVLKKEEPS